MSWTIRTPRRPNRHNEVAEAEARLDQIAGEFHQAHGEISVNSSALRSVSERWDHMTATLNHPHRHAGLAS